MNGASAFLLRAILLLLRLAAAAANPDDDQPNADFFHACSGGELARSKPSQVAVGKGSQPDIRSTWEQGLRMHPLSWNAFYGRYDNIELLLKHGADVNADFDIGKAESGEAKPGTALEAVEQILLSLDDEEEKDRFMQTRNVLVKNGAMRYAGPEEPEL
ncbi:hypothetical protein ACHAXT_004912 [Thalassiosira profunda]